MYRFYPSSFLVSGYNTEVKHFKMLTYVEKFQIESFRVSLRKERTSGLLLPRVFVHQSCFSGAPRSILGSVSQKGASPPSLRPSGPGVSGTRETRWRRGRPRPASLPC